MGSRLVGVMRGLNTDRGVDVAGAARDGGVTVFEVTMDSPCAAGTIEALTSLGHVVGAGTVLSIDDARAAVESGAKFLVSPHTGAKVISWAIERGHPIVPGAYTPTEIVSAWSLGVSAVKLFPASIGGPDLVKAVAAPLRNVPLMVTGGIDASNVSAYLSSGAVAAGIGGWLVGSDELETVRQRAAMLVEAIRAINV